MNCRHLFGSLLLSVVVAVEVVIVVVVVIAVFVVNVVDVIDVVVLLLLLSVVFVAYIVVVVNVQNFFIVFLLVQFDNSGNVFFMLSSSLLSLYKTHILSSINILAFNNSRTDHVIGPN